MTPEMDDLRLAIAAAVEAAYSALLHETGETFYYFSLTTTGEAHPPVISAWSTEQLERLPQARRAALKWSYADSPYYGFGEGHFAEVRRLFSKRPSLGALPSGERQMEYELRLDAMEEALRLLDQRGLFGVGEDRLRLVIHAEVMPPDFTNTERAMRLNLPEALVCWLEEAAE